ASQAISKKISRLNDIIQTTTQKNKAESRKNDSVLMHKPKRCLEFFLHIRNSATLHRHLTLLTKGSPDEIAQQGWDEVTMRRMLFGLLIIFGGGQRPHVATRMTIQEFLDASTTNGVQRIQVKDNKTEKNYGPATMLFLLPNLYSACHKYYQLYKSEHDTASFLLSTQSGKEMNPRSTMDFIVENYLQNIITEEEKQYFIPSIWRHYWSNINRTHKDQDVVAAGRELMAHSESTDNAWYKETDDRRHLEVQWAEKMMDLMTNIHSNPNEEVQDHPEEEEQTVDLQIEQEQEQDQSQHQQEQSHHEPEHSDSDTDTQPPISQSKNATISVHDRELFKAMLKPSSQKYQLGKQIELCKEKSKD
ncbi:MAG TPA: hypothetical protein DDE71_01410, partial [Tenacibaculum sp.]|nr:hypothetical protein [Tenacibaculum sp.]